MATQELDNRGLVPPEPMVRILAALGRLAADDELRALMDREPFPLYAELERRGFAWDFSIDDGQPTLTIRRSST